MVSKMVGNKVNWLKQLRQAIADLLSIPGLNLLAGTEDEQRFSLTISPPDTKTRELALNLLRPHSEIFTIAINYQIWNGSAATKITGNEIVHEAWREDSTLSFEIPDEKLFAEIKHSLSPEGKKIVEKSFSKNLSLLEKMGAELVIDINVTFEKAELLEKYSQPENIHWIIYLSTANFINSIRNKNYVELNQLFTPKSEQTITLLLADASGFARGPNLSIFGLDQWSSIKVDAFNVSTLAQEKVKKIVQFRENECQWESGDVHLTPFHLHLETDKLIPDKVTEILARHRDSLCVGYLANRFRIRDKTIVCDFFGHKHVQVKLSLLNHNSSIALFNLFSWTYEDFSSDKIGILRQIISLQLTENSEINFDLLLKNAEFILKSAKSNFQFFLKRSVELYFDKRIKVSEFLHKFSEEVSTSISGVTTELVNDLYKTVGIILGVMIASLVDPPKIPIIIHWTSLLYFIYIVFILVLLLPSRYLSFRGNVLEFEHNKLELQDVLLEEEIESIEGGAFKRNRLIFLITFTLINLGYSVFGIIAYMISRVS